MERERACRKQDYTLDAMAGTGGGLSNMDNAEEKLTFDVPEGFPGYISEDGRLHIQCVCDGTYAFLYDMVQWLEFIGCTEIETDTKILKEKEAPAGKPWCNCLFEASGVLPKIVED